MLKIDSYSIKGSKLESMVLPKKYEEEVNSKFLAEAIRVLNDRAHFGLAKTKTRAEINKTKRKVYKQKGTGGARHGAKSAPIYVGGGVAHGKKLERRVLRLPKKVSRKALKMAITLKAKKGNLVAIKGVGNLKKTKEAASLIIKIKKNLNYQAKKLTIVLENQNMSVGKVFRNISSTEVVRVDDLNARVVFLGGLILFDGVILEPKVKKIIKNKK